MTGVLRDADGRVIGVTARDADGTPRELTARLVVGADGVRSSLARCVGAEIVEQHEPSGACFYTYVGGVAWDGFQLHVADDAFAGVFPTHRRRGLRLADPARRRLAAGHRRRRASDPPPGMAALDASVPEPGAHACEQGTVTAPLRGYAALPNHLRRPPARAGHWSGTPATTATRSPGTG